MSISSAQMSLQVVTAASSPVARRPTTDSSSPASAINSPAAPTPEVPAPAESSPLPVATDLRIDNQHQFYYEFVDGTTGSVEFEIPPEALRAIGESLNLPLPGDPGASSVDVKS